MSIDATNSIDAMVKVHMRATNTAMSPMVSNCGTAESFEKHSDSALTELQNFMHQSGEATTLALENALEELQEVFLTTLQGQLDAAGIILDNRLEISLSEHGDLLLEGGCTDDDRLQQAVCEHPLLQPLFRQLHALALMVEGLEYLRCAQVPSEQSAALPRYHICLKGTLSHFYLR